jgi:hypothetical protein
MPPWPELRSRLEPRLEIAGDDFPFWKPEDAPYETKSTPK